MIDKLLELQKNSYSPYFNFRVSAIVVTKDNKEFGGVNVENANGTSICAERNAIASCVAAGYKKGDIESIHILTDGEKIGTPCFSCRQVLLEFMDKDNLVYCYDKQGNFLKYTIDELCPYPFDSGSLK